MNSCWDCRIYLKSNGYRLHYWQLWKPRISKDLLLEIHVEENHAHVYLALPPLDRKDERK